MGYSRHLKKYGIMVIPIPCTHYHFWSIVMIRFQTKRRNKVHNQARHITSLWNLEFDSDLERGK